jgi:hypothetical protein
VQPGHTVDHNNSLPDSGVSEPHNPQEQVEYFVDAAVAAQFLSIKRKYLLKLSRQGQIPAHPIGCGKRKQWRYLISEIRQWMLSSTTKFGLGPCATRPDNRVGSPRAATKGGR